MIKPVIPLLIAATVTITAPCCAPNPEQKDKPPQVENLPTLKHTVRDGETLWKIGVGYGIPWQKVARWNGKEDTRIYVGEELMIKLEPNEVWASYYGCEDRIFHGRPMANGEPFDEADPTTVAHKYLPLGTKVRVYNPENERSLEMTVRDRGPYVGARVIDLSCAAAKNLGTREKGVAKIVLEVLELPYN